MGKETYSAVAESGSWCEDRYEEKAHCGHNHRTIKAACKCLDKLNEYDPDYRFAGTIHNQDCQQVEYNDEMQEIQEEKY